MNVEYFQLYKNKQANALSKTCDLFLIVSYLHVIKFILHYKALP